MSSISIIGCGAIGRLVAEGVHQGLAGDYRVVSVFDLPQRARAASLAADIGCIMADDLGEMLATKPDLVIEAATGDALHQCAQACLEHGSSLIVLSSGALTDRAFLNSLLALAVRHGVKIYVPSGAIGGLDLVRAAVMGEKAKAIFTSRKPPRALVGAPHLMGRDLCGLNRAETVFEGTVPEAVAGFPQNVNVAASLSLAMGGAEHIRQAVIADPELDLNVHRIEIQGSFGTASIEIRARPMSTNPKTSMVAAYSVLALLARIKSPLEVGA
ncbi:MAG: aspartate dehydrogenase [Bacillota bacterium]|nr:aspartate dehydrogenase [Bacillota bacterium]